jgi:hypothetical protein
MTFLNCLAEGQQMEGLERQGLSYFLSILVYAATSPGVGFGPRLLLVQGAADLLDELLPLLVGVALHFGEALLNGRLEATGFERDGRLQEGAELLIHGLACLSEL